MARCDLRTPRSIFLFICALFMATFGAPSSAWAQSLHGVFMVVKGDVQILKEGAAPEKAKVGSKIHPGQTVATGADSRAKIVMSDRNVVNVSPDTKLLIEKYENDPKKGTKDVEMKLIEGKVRNNVEQKYDGEKSKFIIKTPTAVAGVRGTQFMTSFSPRTGMTQIVTMKGAVSFSSLGKNGLPLGPPVMVNKGETASAAAGAPPEPPKPMPKEELQKVDAETTASASGPSDGSGPAPTAGSGESAAKEEGGGGSREPAAAAGPAGAGGGESMIDSKDLDVGMAREVTTPPPAAAAAAAAQPRAPTSAAPAVNQIVKEVVRESFGKTKVIVKPKSQ